MSVPHKTKSQPFRLLTLLLYGSYSFISWQADTVTLSAGKTSRLFRVSRERLWEYMEWLAEQGYVKDVFRAKAGTVTSFSMTVNRPERWRKQA